VLNSQAICASRANTLTRKRACITTGIGIMILAWGMYIEADPAGLAAGTNLYSYVGGNPLRYVDPTGLNAAIPVLVGLTIYGGYELWHSYDELIQCKKECKEKTKSQCEAGNTSGYHQCESQCLLNAFGGLGSKGPKGPTPQTPIP
jgi:hypothetical protein